MKAGKSMIVSSTDIKGIDKKQDHQQILNENKAILDKADQSKSFSIRYRPNYTQTGFAYSIIDGLFNGQFNMVYVKEKSEEELKLKEKYFNIGKVCQLYQCR